MKMLIALFTRCAEADDRDTAPGWWAYFGSFGDDIFSADDDDTPRNLAINI